MKKVVKVVIIGVLLLFGIGVYLAKNSIYSMMIKSQADNLWNGSLNEFEEDAADYSKKITLGLRNNKIKQNNVMIVRSHCVLWCTIETIAIGTNNEDRKIAYGKKSALERVSNRHKGSQKVRDIYGSQNPTVIYGQELVSQAEQVMSESLEGYTGSLYGGSDEKFFFHEIEKGDKKIRVQGACPLQCTLENIATKTKDQKREIIYSTVDRRQVFLQHNEAYTTNLIPNPPTITTKDTPETRAYRKTIRETYEAIRKKQDEDMKNDKTIQ